MTGAHGSWGLLLSVGVLLISLRGEVAAAPRAGRLYAGWASTNITPDKPVALSGQFHTRISKSVHDPVTATALAVEVKDADGVVDQAIIVSCDVVAIRDGIQEKFRKRLAGRLDGVDHHKVFLNATHTHTGPVLSNVRRFLPDASGETAMVKYKIPKEGVTQVSEYVEFLVGRLADATVAAWNGRKPAGVSWALSHAVIGHNRRVVYSDGNAVMYGKTDSPRFRNIEGSTDHGVELLFFWNDAGQPTGIAINVACPSQVVESKGYLSADFWHDVRAQLRDRYGKDLQVLALCGAAGDQSPHFLYRKRAEATLRKRAGRSEMQEAGTRIARAVECVFDVAKGDIRTTVPFAHRVETLALPARQITADEAARSKARVEKVMSAGTAKLSESGRVKLTREQNVVAQYENQKARTYAMELHVLRLGNVAIATNPFELFIDFGLRMKARSKAEQTFIIQLACNSGVYLPTEKARQAGGYGAEPPSNLVGPEGGGVLVDRTVELINAMWTGGK